MLEISNRIFYKINLGKQKLILKDCLKCGSENTIFKNKYRKTIMVCKDCGFIEPVVNTKFW